MAWVTPGTVAGRRLVVGQTAEMIRLTPLDELLAHQVPEPMANVQTFHPHWRESYFFIAHRPDALGEW